MHFRSSVVMGCLLSTARSMISSSSISQFTYNSLNSLPDEQVQRARSATTVVEILLVSPFHLHHSKLLLDVEFAAVPRISFLHVFHRHHCVVGTAICGSVDVNMAQ